ncbi:hypothetical protein ACFL7D_01695 [candidate division KSB1 bacterium]
MRTILVLFLTFTAVISCKKVTPVGPIPELSEPVITKMTATPDTILGNKYGFIDLRQDGITPEDPVIEVEVYDGDGHETAIEFYSTDGRLYDKDKNTVRFQPWLTQEKHTIYSTVSDGWGSFGAVRY